MIIIHPHDFLHAGLFGLWCYMRLILMFRKCSRVTQREFNQKLFIYLLAGAFREIECLLIKVREVMGSDVEIYSARRMVERNRNVAARNHCASISKTAKITKFECIYWIYPLKREIIIFLSLLDDTTFSVIMFL